MNNKEIIGVRDKVPFSMLIPLSLQHTFAMFGASVLVPILFNVNPGIVLLMNGIGTLLFIFITKGKAPAYLGSSFAFLGVGGVIINTMGYRYALGAFATTGFLGCILAYIIYKFRTDWINIVLPPAAMGAVVSLIGLELAGNTIRGGKIGANILTETSTNADVYVFLITLSVAILGSVVFRKFLGTIPILIAIICGYIAALAFGMIDFSAVTSSTLFTIPDFQFPIFDFKASLIMFPALLVITSEHISHQVVTSNIIGQNLLEDPGLHRSIFADNFSTMLSALVGGVPTTTYGENIGVMAVTKVYSVYVIAGAAVISICMAFIAPLSMLIQSIPGNVIGGITFLLYGMIGTSGIRLLVDSKVDYSNSQNLILTSVVFVTGLSGISINFFGMELKGMVLASMVAVVLSLIFHFLNKFGLSNNK